MNSECASGICVDSICQNQYEEEPVYNKPPIKSEKEDQPEEPEEEDQPEEPEEEYRPEEPVLYNRSTTTSLLSQYTDYTSEYDGEYESDIDEVRMFDNMIEPKIFDNDSPVIKQDKLMIKNRSLLPTTLDIDIIDFAPFTSKTILVATKNSDTNTSFIFDTENRSVLPIHMNLHVDQLERVGDKMFAVSSYALYYTDIPKLSKGMYITNLTWKQITDVPISSITHISPSSDKLWIQSRRQGCNMSASDFKYDKIETIEPGSLRILGITKGHASLMDNGLAIVDGIHIDRVYMPISTEEGWDYIWSDDHKRGYINGKNVNGDIVKYRRA